jgi:RNA polymerase sigma factor (TIGR02999 family)
MSHLEITQLLEQINEGHDELWSALMEQTYVTVLNISRQIRGVKKHELHPTYDTFAVLGDAFSSLYDSKQIVWKDRKHFYLTVAQACRYVITDYDRNKKSLKRGKEFEHVPMTEVALELMSDPEMIYNLAALNTALDQLAKVNQRAWEGVMFRFYIGLKEAEIAELQQVSTRTVIRDWIAARAFMASIFQDQQ